MWRQAERNPAMSEAQRRVQLAAVERSLDLLEDPTVTAEDMQRMIPEDGVGGWPAIDDVIDAFRRRIARWEAPGPIRTQEELRAAYISYVRLGRLANALSEQMLACVDQIERELEQP
jgi:hypothetical protein